MSFWGNCFKYFFFILNFAFALCGLTLLIIGTVIHFDTLELGNESDIISSGSIPYTRLLIIGLTLIITSIFGYCSAKRRNYYMIATYTLLLLMILFVVCTKEIHGDGIQKHYRMMIFKNFQNKREDFVAKYLLNYSECCSNNGSINSENNVTAEIHVLSCCSPEELQQRNCSINSDNYLPGCSSLRVNNILSTLGILERLTFVIGSAEFVLVVLTFCLGKLGFCSKREVYKVCDVHE